MFRARELQRTLVLVSTSGATDGFTGAQAWADSAKDGPIDAVLVLGDLAGARAQRPWVVPWSLGRGPAPLALQRTVESAVRVEAGRPDGSRAIAQWMRRSLPFTVSEQGVIADAGLPAVFIGVSGERGPGASEPVRRGRLERFGRGVLRAVSAIDALPTRRRRAGVRPKAPTASPRCATCCRTGRCDCSSARCCCPRSSRRSTRSSASAAAGSPSEPWLLWLLATGFPVVMVWLWVRALGLANALDPPDAPMLPLPPIERSGAIAIASALLVFAIGVVRRAGADPRARGRAREPDGRRPGRRHRAGAVRAGRARVGGQPVCRGAAAARRAPVAVRRRAADASAPLGRRGRRRRRGCCRSPWCRCTTH